MRRAQPVRAGRNSGLASALTVVTGIATLASACGPTTVPTDASRDTGFRLDSGSGCASAFVAFRYSTNSGPSRDACIALVDGVRQDYLSASGCRPAAISATGVLASGSRIVIDGYGDPFSSTGNHTFGIAVEGASGGDADLCGASTACRFSSGRCAFDVIRAGGRGEIVEARLAAGGCQLTDLMTAGSVARPFLNIIELTLRAPLVRGADLSPMASDAGACP